MFPNLFRVAAPCRKKDNLRHRVGDPQQFALTFDDILKTDVLQNVLTRSTPEYCKWHTRVSGRPGWEPLPQTIAMYLRNSTEPNFFFNTVICSPEAEPKAAKKFKTLLSNPIKFWFKQKL